MAAQMHQPGTPFRALDSPRLPKVTRRQVSALRELGRLVGPLPVGPLAVSLQNLGDWTMALRSLDVFVASDVRQRLDLMAVAFRLESADGAELVVATDAHLVVAICAAVAGQMAPPAVARRATESEAAVVGVVVASLVNEVLDGTWHLVGTERNPGAVLDAKPGRHAFSTLTAAVGLGDGWGQAFVAAAFGQSRAFVLELPNRLMDRLDGMVLSVLLRTGRFALTGAETTGLMPGSVVLVGEATGLVLDVGHGGFAGRAPDGLDPVWNGLMKVEIVGGFMDHRDESGGFEPSEEFGMDEMESGPSGSTGSSGAFDPRGDSGSSQYQSGGGGVPGEHAQPGDEPVRQGEPDGNGRPGDRAHPTDYGPGAVMGGTGGPSGVVLDGMMLDGVVELGRLQLLASDVATLVRGAIVELDRPVGSKAVLRVGGKIVAHGSLVDVEGVLGFRVEDLT